MADGTIKIDTRIDPTGIDKGVKDINSKLSSVGEGMKSVGDSMSQYVTLPLVAMATGAIKVASDFNSSQAQIQNSLGLTANEASNLNDVVRDVWKDGFGASLDEVTNSLLEVKQNMKGLNDGDLEQATKSAMTLAQTFDSDVNEVTRAGGNIMETFGVTAEKSFDLMAYGAQNGLNYSNEMFDNLSEYSADFARAGYSVDEMFQTLIKGSQTGTYNLDQLNDVVREFGIQGSENTKTFSDGISRLSPATQAMYQNFKDGKATMKEVMDAAVNDLKGVESQTELNSIGTELFGA